MPNNSGPNLHGKLDPAHTASKTQDVIDNMIRIGTVTEVQLDSKGFPGEDIENMTNEDENGNFRYPLYKVRFDEDAEENVEFPSYQILKSSKPHKSMFLSESLSLT